MRSLLAAMLAGAIGLAIAASAQAGPVATRPARLGNIGELPLGPSQRVSLFGLTAGPDGTIWFADLGCIGTGRCGIASLDARGAVTLFSRGLRPGSVPYEIAAGPDGNLWFTDQGRRPAIGRITPGGRITEFSRGLRRDSMPAGITPSPGGDLWFTDRGRHPAIGRITAGGAITEFSRGLARGSAPFGIAASSSAIWFTDQGCAAGGRCRIGRVTLSGRVSESRAGLGADADPLGIAAGFGGTIWFADGAGAIGEVAPAGHVREHRLPAGSAPVAIAAGPDGGMWFTEQGSPSSLGRISPAGAVRSFASGLAPGSLPGAIAPAPDGNLWFTDEGRAAALGRVSTGAPAALRARPALDGLARPGQTLRCGPASFAPWAGLAPSLTATTSDGYEWERDGVPRGRGDLWRVRVADVGHRLACRVTATYPSPFLTPVVGRSRAVLVRH